MPATDEPSSPSSDDPSGAQASLLRLSRRHSLPASSALFSFWTPPSPPPVTSAQRPSTQHQRSSSFAVNGASRPLHHHPGHRRSESLNQPVIVKAYNPPPRTPDPILREVINEDDEDCKLPDIADFGFEGILKAVDPEVKRTFDAVAELCDTYRDSVRTEVHSLTMMQACLDKRMKEADAVAARALKTTRVRSEKLDSETAGLKNGAAVDRLAEATEATHGVMTSILTTLLLIDEMLPPADRLSPSTSAHRHHYPRLHTLLSDKATELNLCFSARTSPPVPAESSTVWQRRRMSSASTHVMLSRSNSYRAPPHLQLKTILPNAAMESPKLVDSANGSYFPLAPQTSTGVSTTSAERRGSGVWSKRPSTSALAFFPINEGEVDMPPPQTPATTNRMSWRGSGSWSGLGGWFGGGGRRSSGGSSEMGRERAEERLRKVLEEGKGKGVRA